MRAIPLQIALIFLALASCISRVTAQDLSTLLSRFQSESDRASKEATLMKITTDYRGAGPALLTIARETKDEDTKWLAIRGVGYLKFSGAAPFLKQSLQSKSVYVRANAARALGEVHDTSAAPGLIKLLSDEPDSSVIEQTALALEMLGAKEALPALKLRARNTSPQTRIWILGAIELLGSRADVPFFIPFLNDDNESVVYFAGLSIERMTGQDFGFPKCPGNGPCGIDNDAGVQNAMRWWNDHKQEWHGDSPVK